MKRIIYTCPFTGMEFEATEFADGTVVCYHPVTGDEIRMSYNPSIKKYMINPSAFKHVETISISEAAKILKVSVPRVSMLCSSGQLAYHMVKDQKRLIKSEVVEYSRYRKPGRPRKKE